MAKQIYIDSNGNEVELSGTINSADMLPISAGSSTMTDDVIDAKANSSDLIVKNVSQSSVSVGANTIQSLTLSAPNAKYIIIAGVYISGDAVVPMQFYFSAQNEIYFRLRNLTNVATTCNITIFYL